MDEDKSYEKLKTVPDHIRYKFTNQDSIALRKNGVYYKAAVKSYYNPQNKLCYGCNICSVR